MRKNPVAHLSSGLQQHWWKIDKAIESFRESATDSKTIAEWLIPNSSLLWQHYVLCTYTENFIMTKSAWDHCIPIYSAAFGSWNFHSNLRTQLGRFSCFDTVRDHYYVGPGYYGQLSVHAVYPRCVQHQLETARIYVSDTHSVNDECIDFSEAVLWEEDWPGLKIWRLLNQD